MQSEINWTTFAAAAYDFKVSRSTLHRAVCDGRIRVHRQSARCVFLWQPDIRAMTGEPPAEPMTHRDTTEALSFPGIDPTVRAMSEKSMQKFKAWKEACGFTTCEAAGELGFDAQEIVAIERGWKPVTEEIAQCAATLSGVCEFSFFDDDLEGPTTPNMEPFTRTHYLRWPQSRTSIAALGGARHAINLRRF